MKKYLQELGIDASKFNITEESINDILLLRKKFTQGVSFKVGQADIDQEEEFMAIKTEISRTTKFKAEDYDIGEHKVTGIEPGSFKVDDCITCDGHGEMSCDRCNGTTEEKCSSCLGKGSKTIENTVYRKEEGACGACKGRGSKSMNCASCKGRGQLIKKIPCNACRSAGKIKGPNGFQACTLCRGAGSISQSFSCAVCGGSRSITKNCGPCKGSGRAIISKPYKENNIKTCHYCKGQGRKSCTKCKGLGNITCYTCNGNRRTTQYEFNTFVISVKPCYELITGKLSFEALEALALAPSQKVEYLLSGEKDKLKNKLVQHKLKLTEKIASRVKGTLFILEDKLTGYSYYIYESKDKFYCKNTPPKSDLGSYKDYYFSKINAFFTKYIGKVWRKIENFFTGKNEY